MNAPFPGPPSVPDTPWGLPAKLLALRLLQCWARCPWTGLGWSGPPGPPLAHSQTPTSGARAPVQPGLTSATSKKGLDGHCLFGQAERRPKVVCVGCRASCGCRLHCGIFPPGHCRVGWEFHPSRLSGHLALVTKPALPVGAGNQACLRGTRGQLLGPCREPWPASPKLPGKAAGHAGCLRATSAPLPPPFPSVSLVLLPGQSVGLLPAGSALQLPEGSQPQRWGLGAA